MKQINFMASMSVAACMLISFSSCNSGEEKKAETPAVDTVKAEVKAPEPPPPALVKPANVLIIKHKVANYTKWKAKYDAHDSVRLAYGLHNYVVARGLKDTNMVMIALKYDDLAKAKQFSTSPDLKKAMQKAGVVGAPTFMYEDVQFSDTATLTTALRVMVTHKVKDWDAWKKVFESDKTKQTESGLVLRVLSFEAGDNHNVRVVAAVTDLKKAEAFFASKELKAKMAESGVVGAPSIFYFNIVERHK